MSVRPTMGELLERTRTLIFDPDPQPGTSVTVFSNQQIQDALDFWREEQRWVPLRPMPTYYPGGVIQYLDYYQTAQNWEADVVLQDLTYTTIQPSLSELIVGHWQFTTQPTGIGVRATGKTYDLYASAADLLSWWVAQIKLKALDVSSGSNSTHASQQIHTLMGLIEQYRRLALPHTARIFQGDAAPDQDGGGVTFPNVGQTSY